MWTFSFMILHRRCLVQYVINGMCTSLFVIAVLNYYMFLLAWFIGRWYALLNDSFCASFIYLSEVLYIQILYEHIFLSVHLKCFCRTVEDVVTYKASGTRICSFFLFCVFALYCSMYHREVHKWWSCTLLLHWPVCICSCLLNLCVCMVCVCVCVCV